MLEYQMLNSLFDGGLAIAARAVAQAGWVSGPMATVRRGGAAVSITLAALLLLSAAACGESRRPTPTPDGAAVTLANRGSLVRDVTYDDQRRTWFLVPPHRYGADEQPGFPTLVCRWSGRELACGAIPGTEKPEKGDGFRIVKLIPPANGAIPHVLVQRATGSQIFEPFSWRLVRELDDDALYSGELLIWADGSLLATGYGGPKLALPNEPFRPLRGFPSVGYVRVALSRWGLVWLEFGPRKDDTTLKAAPLNGTELGPIRIFGQHPSWTATCRDGDTFGFLVLSRDTSRASVGMLDLATGEVIQSPATGAYKVQCRRGQVGGIAINLRDELSGYCDRSGCRTLATAPSGEHEHLNYHQLGLGDGGLLLVSTVMSASKIVTERIGHPPRVQRVADARSLIDAQLVMTNEGALVIYLGGEVLALDQQGSLLPIELRWPTTAQ